MSVVIETTLGDFTVDLFVQERPRTCMNFLKLCKMKYYNMQLFYKVTPNFMCQAGDPTASGRGGDSIFRFIYGEQARFFEVEKLPRLKHLKLGTLSMVNNGDGMLGSQFLITLGECIDCLDDQHCVFGEVVEGLEFLERINNVICDKEERPFQDIRISHTVILHDPFDEPAQLEYPASPEVTLEKISSDRIACYEQVDDNEGKTAEQLAEEMKDKEAKAQATILEIIGDLPDAEMAPPENVLFVCKLNPLTGDDDLELIFSRFGEVKRCEVIRDWKTGESLQYAFIEFAERKACEQAYFKMDNVLIDDRRIHVDFSQSVAKVKWRGKGKGVVGNWKEGDETERSRAKYRIKDNCRQDGYKLIMTDDHRPERAKEKKVKSKPRKRSRSRSREGSSHSKSPIKHSSSAKNRGGSPKLSRGSSRRDGKSFRKRSSEEESPRESTRGQNPKGLFGSRREPSPRKDRSPRMDSSPRRYRSPVRDRNPKRQRSPVEGRNYKRHRSPGGEPRRERNAQLERSPKRDRDISGRDRSHGFQEKPTGKDRTAKRKIEPSLKSKGEIHNRSSDTDGSPSPGKKETRLADTSDTSDDSDSSEASAAKAKKAKKSKSAKKKAKKEKKSRKSKKRKKSKHH